MIVLVRKVPAEAAAGMREGAKTLFPLAMIVLGRKLPAVSAAGLIEAMRAFELPTMVFNATVGRFIPPSIESFLAEPLRPMLPLPPLIAVAITAATAKHAMIILTGVEMVMLMVCGIDVNSKLDLKDMRCWLGWGKRVKYEGFAPGGKI
jgi:hypothetical protein